MIIFSDLIFEKLKTKLTASRCLYRSRPPNSLIKQDHDEHQETGCMVEESSSHRSGTSAPRRTRTRGRGEGERGRWEMTCRGCPSLSCHHRSSSKICVPWPSGSGTKSWPKSYKIFRIHSSRVVQLDYTPVSQIARSCWPAPPSSWWWCSGCSGTPSPAPASGGRCTLSCTCLLFWSELKIIRMSNKSFISSED